MVQGNREENPMSVTTLSRVLADLGHHLSEHEPTGCLAALTIAAQAASPVAPGAAAALADPRAPVVVRGRALAVASRALVRELSDEAAERLAASLAQCLRSSTSRPEAAVASAPWPVHLLQIA
jgi:hypothetical protein